MTEITNCNCWFLRTWIMRYRLGSTAIFSSSSPRSLNEGRLFASNTQPTIHAQKLPCKLNLTRRARSRSRTTYRRIYSLGSVQRAATRLSGISGFKKLSYEQRLRSAGLTTLEVRRQRGDLIECYKILQERRTSTLISSSRLSDNSHGLHGHSLNLLSYLSTDPISYLEL